MDPINLIELFMTEDGSSVEVHEIDYGVEYAGPQYEYLVSWLKPDGSLWCDDYSTYSRKDALNVAWLNP